MADDWDEDRTSPRRRRGPVRQRKRRNTDWPEPETNEPEEDVPIGIPADDE